jgi:hypothetical protein
MSLQEYNAVLQRLKPMMGFALFAPIIIGEAGALYLTSRLAASSSWASWQVCLSMFPVFIAPILIAAMIAQFVDKRIGFMCDCGQSLTFGPHVAHLMREGGQCPRCGKLVVEGEK